MKFTILTPSLCAKLDHDEFGGRKYKNKTSEALDKEVCKYLIGTSCVPTYSKGRILHDSFYVPQNSEFFFNSNMRSACQEMLANY
eukprot:15356447-Ditylum_brightwellii.AAC.1